MALHMKALLKRGPLVDQQALYKALTSGQIGAAGLDVCEVEPIATDDKLLSLSNCGELNVDYNV